MTTPAEHGDYIEHEGLWGNIAFCEDRTVLENLGDGWKAHGKLKASVKDYKEAAKINADAVALACEKRPAYKELRRILLPHSIEARRAIWSVFAYLGDDIDGIWSAINENPFSPYCGENRFTVEDIKELHAVLTAYKESVNEQV